jgi:ABC-type transport system involved in multi-copper enzyme maturation permease subunit
MTQTWAIFLEAYRNLNSKKLFWLVLILSALVVVAFACLGINEKGLKIAFWQIDNNIFNTKQMPPDQFYKTIFVQIGIGIWLSWLATILAIISTAGIFPDLLASGSIDLFVSKPISRLRLFITEYTAGLLFVALQVTIFSMACFLVIGFRGGVWEPALFLAVPIMVCFFSYLFSVSTLLGVVTRSTVAALLLTLLFWFFVWAVGAAENTLLMFKTMQQRGVDFAAVQAESRDNKAKTPDTPEKPAESPSTEKSKPVESPSAEKPKPAESPSAEKPKPAESPSTSAEKPKESLSPSAEKAKPAAADDSKDSRVLDIAHHIVYGVKTVLPKTTETIALLERSLVRLAKLPQQPRGPQTERMQAAQLEFIEILHARSIAWVVGTSLGFEIFVLFWAALFFCRRNY